MPTIPRTDYKKILFTAPKSAHDGWRLRGHVQSVLQNGVGRYVCQLKRLTLVFCKSKSDSFGVRQFIEHDLVNFASTHPGIAVYVQPKYNISPYITGEYLNDRRASIHASGFSREEVNLWVDQMRTRSGQRIVAFEHNWRTENPSIQGIWDPFLNVPTEQNIESFPSEKLSRFKAGQLSATEVIMEIMKEKVKLE